MTMPDPHTPPQQYTRRLVWAGLLGAGAMLTLVLAVLIGYWLGRQDTPSTPQPAIAPHTSTDPATSINNRHLPVQPIITDPVVLAPIPDPTTRTALPTDTALAGEELDLHQDEQSRLQQQQQSLKQQVQDSETLMKLKAEQIAALEAQLAAESPQATP
jgi:hypothetical protein